MPTPMGNVPKAIFRQGKGGKQEECYQLTDDGQKAYWTQGEGDWVEWPVE